MSDPAQNSGMLSSRQQRLSAGSRGGEGTANNTGEIVGGIGLNKDALSKM